MTVNELTGRLSRIFPERDVCAALTGAAVALENGIGDKDLDTFLDFAEAVNRKFMAADDPRFSLYDLLDAAVNAPHAAAKSWHDFIRSDIGILIEAAEQKRRIYEGDF